VTRIVDRSHKGESGQLPDAWDRHQRAAGRGGPRHTSDPRRNQTTHGGRETRDPFAGFESAVEYIERGENAKPRFVAAKLCANAASARSPGTSPMSLHQSRKQLRQPCGVQAFMPALAGAVAKLA
jgi:hypothetical protein